MSSGNAAEVAASQASSGDAAVRPQALVTSRAANRLLDAATYAAFVAILASTSPTPVVVAGAIAAPVLVAAMRRLL